MRRQAPLLVPGVSATHRKCTMGWMCQILRALRLLTSSLKVCVSLRHHHGSTKLRSHSPSTAPGHSHRPCAASQQPYFEQLGYRVQSAAAQDLQDDAVHQPVVSGLSNFRRGGPTCGACCVHQQKWETTLLLPSCVCLERVVEWKSSRVHVVVALLPVVPGIAFVGF